jgi:hypothetical protein
MNLAELIEAVYVETNRPDLPERTLQSVLAATRTIHGIDFFPRDIVAAQVKFDAAAYIQSIDLDVLPRFRKLSYFRKNDPSFAAFQQNPNILPPIFYDGGSPQAPIWQMTDVISVIDPDNIFDDFGYQKSDVCYLAGATILIRSGTLLNWGLIGWYQRPAADPYTVDGGVSYPRYVSWIAKDYPYAIVYKAAAMIFASTGNNEMSNRYDRQPDPNKPNDRGGMAQEQISLIIQDNLLLGMSS